MYRWNKPRNYTGQHSFHGWREITAVVNISKLFSGWIRLSMCNCVVANNHTTAVILH